MKNFILIVGMFFVVLVSNAQVVSNSQFKAMTYDELMAPVLMVQKFHKECLYNLEVLASQTEQIEQFISKEKDPNTWRRYVDCYNSIINAYNSILDNGTNQGTRNTISKLKRESNSLIVSIKSAYDRRNRLSNDQYARLRAVEGLRCSRFFSDISIDEFMNGKTPMVTYHTTEDLNITHQWFMNRNDNAIANALSAVYSQMFPGGKKEEQILTQELYELFSNRIQKRIINQALCCTLSSIILSIAKTKEQIMEVLSKRFESKLTVTDKEIIIQFVLLHNSMASLIFRDETKY